MKNILIKVWWESNNLTNSAFLVTSNLEEDHPLAGCWNSVEELIEASLLASFNVTVEEV